MSPIWGSPFRQRATCLSGLISEARWAAWPSPPEPPPRPSPARKPAPRMGHGGGSRGEDAAPSPARRGARPVRPTPAAPAYPFPVALAGESSIVELTKGEHYPEPGAPIPPERIDRSFVRLGGARPMPLTSAKADGAVTRLEANWAGQGLATLGVLLAPEAVTVEVGEATQAQPAADTAPEEKPKRKRAPRKKKEEAAAEVAPDAAAEPEAAPVPEPVAEAAPPEPAPAARAVPEPAPEPAMATAEEEAKPKKKGWWSLR